MNPLPLQTVTIRNGVLRRNGQPLTGLASMEPADHYRALGYSYPKFFKMDKLCKWAWLAAEALLCPPGAGSLYQELSKDQVAVVLLTRDGCLEVDHRYAATLDEIPSPALFVYTLPNIALGEICIRHGFTGEQLCEVKEEFDAPSIAFWVKDLLGQRGMTGCLFGWVDAVGENQDICLFWASSATTENLVADQLQSIYNSHG